MFHLSVCTLFSPIAFKKDKLAAKYLVWLRLHYVVITREAGFWQKWSQPLSTAADFRGRASPQPQHAYKKHAVPDQCTSASFTAPACHKGWITPFAIGYL